MEMLQNNMKVVTDLFKIIISHIREYGLSSMTKTTFLNNSNKVSFYLIVQKMTNLAH
ncbi:hypothetical protein Hanom_Chr03g00182041 [Helianthus anomalus]